LSPINSVASHFFDFSGACGIGIGGQPEKEGK